MYGLTIVCRWFPLTIMYLGFSSFTSNPFASEAVCNAIKDFFMSSFDLPVMTCQSANASRAVTKIKVTKCYTCLLWQKMDIFYTTNHYSQVLISIVTRLQAGQWRKYGSIPSRVKEFFSLPVCLFWLLDLEWVLGAFLPGIKWLECVADH
jgi:hypothetical protein